MTSDPDFKVTTFFDIEYLRNDTIQSHSYYRTSIGSHMCSITRWHSQWPWRTLTRFSRSWHVWSRISKKRRVLKTKLLLHNRKLYLTYEMVLCLVTLTDLQTRRAGLSASSELLVSIATGVQHDGRVPFWKPASVFDVSTDILFLLLANINILLKDSQIFRGNYFPVLVSAKF